MWFFGRDQVVVEKRMNVGVRMEALGGQGAHSAGKILVEAAVLGQGYTGNHFSSFGSEKRGTPVRSFVRYSVDRKVIRSASMIREPELLCVFHENLMSSHPSIFDGVGPFTDVLINSPLGPHQLLLPVGVHPRWLATVDAQKIAIKTSAGVNAVLLGAMAHFLPEIERERLKSALDTFFSKAGAEKRQANWKGFQAGFDEVKIKTPLPGQDQRQATERALPRMGYENAPIGGVIVNPGNTVMKSHEGSRKGIAPRLNLDECCHCGFCDMVCPDFCFNWTKKPGFYQGAQLLGLDYQFCKGCGKCVEICPVGALTQVPESEIPDSEKQVSFLKANCKG